MDLSINEGTLVVTGGPGVSVQTAIVIRRTPKGLSAAGAEHMILTQRHGAHGKGWTLERQDLLEQDGRVYDVFFITLGDGATRTVFFEVTDCLRAAGHMPA